MQKPKMKEMSKKHSEPAKKRLKKPALGVDFALVSRRNRIFPDRRKEESRRLCRRKVEVSEE